ncbi:MAG: hypothetical protein L0191_00325, partial [Acidobacteria bacterium]|nr:hypothetical protein [Acidobacteriota bacterium]
MSPDVPGQPDDATAVLDAFDPAVSAPEVPATGTPSSEGTPAPATDGTPEPAAPSSDGAPSPAPAVPGSTPPDLSAYTPPQGGTPFSFRVDRTDVAPSGAQVLGDYIVFPKASWTQFRDHWVGNRQVWRQKELEYRQALTERPRAEPESSKTQEEVRALLDTLTTLFTGPREDVLARFENWHVDGPRLQAEAKARAVEAQLARYQEQEQQARRQQAEQAAIPQLKHEIGNEIVEALLESGIGIT